MSGRMVSARRGSAYLLVLGVSMVVVMIGVTGSSLMRLRSVDARLGESEVRAEFLARSAAEIVLKRLNLDDAWREANSSGVWSGDEAIDGGTFRFMLRDEDGDLDDEAGDRARLHVSATIAGATRIYSVEIESERGEGENLLANGGFEGGTTSWSRYFATLGLDTTSPMEGSQALRVTGRSPSLGSPTQNVTSVVRSGVTYDVRMWIRIEGASRQVRANINGTTLLLVGFASSTPWVTVPGDTWYRFDASVTPVFLNGLSVATLSFYTDLGSEVLLFDDVQLVERSTASVVRFVPGSWRREVNP